MAHFESWQRLRIMAAVVNEDKVFSNRNKQKNRLTVIVNLFLNLWR